MATTASPDNSAPAAKPNTKTTNSGGISPQVVKELNSEINNMLSFAIFNGVIVNTQVNSLIQNSSVDDLINAHNILCQNIAPATPKSIQYTKKLHQVGSEKSIYNKLPLVRNLVFLAIFFLIAFVATGLSPLVNDASLDKGIMHNEGWPLLLNIFFLSSISGLGVTFYLLKTVNKAFRDGTLIPEDTIYYIALIVLGIISGLIMSEIISFYTKDPQGINLFNKSVLALIGGFSSDAIFSVLQSIIARIKSIFAAPSTPA